MQFTFSPFSIVLHFLWFKYGAFQLSENPNCSLVISSNNFYAYFTHLAPPLEAVRSASSQLDHPQKKCAKCNSSTLTFQTPGTRNPQAQTRDTHGPMAFRLYRLSNTSAQDISTQLSMPSFPMEGMTIIQRQNSTNFDYIPKF